MPDDANADPEADIVIATVAAIMFFFILSTYSNIVRNNLETNKKPSIHLINVAQNKSAIHENPQFSFSS
ncbi:hypothetical protein BOW30_10065 [Solemya velum gill symbiont]|nr:hypothetical protein BOW30_10065 [Solemya velum gill symbiont]